VDNLLDGVGRQCGKRSDRVPRDRAPRSSARCFCREAVAVHGRHVKADTNRDSRTNWAPTCLCHVEVDVRGRFGSNRWLLRADVETGDAVGESRTVSNKTGREQRPVTTQLSHRTQKTRPNFTSVKLELLLPLNHSRPSFGRHRLFIGKLNPSATRTEPSLWSANGRTES
jgi:hypothetical protein